MITEDYVSFEIAKLLKEKGFDEPCRAIYALIVKKNLEIYESASAFSNTDIITKNLRAAVCTCPTLQMTMKWLREVHGLFIRITEDITGNVYEWSIYQKNHGCRASMYVEDSYEQAEKAAIKYCLKTLI